MPNLNDDVVMHTYAKLKGKVSFFKCFLLNCSKLTETQAMEHAVEEGRRQRMR